MIGRKEMDRKERDIQLFRGDLLDSLFRATETPNGQCYWDDVPRHKLDQLVTHLSDPNQEERKVIREALKRHHVKSVLDAGCGPAVELASYRSIGLGACYTGLDKSKAMLGIARRQFPDVPFVEGSVEQMPFYDSSFDAVVIKHVLEHLPSYQRAVQEAIRVAKDVVIINFFHRLLPGSKDIPIWTRHAYWDNWYSREKFEAFLETQPVKGYDTVTTSGVTGNTAMIYTVEKE